MARRLVIARAEKMSRLERAVLDVTLEERG